MTLSESVHDDPAASQGADGTLGFEPDGEVEDEFCGGCGKLVEEDAEDADDEGIIHFANKYWHYDCFRCAKCHNRVSMERDDILLLSDGFPICGECNYSCNICGLPILEEAIMTGDESYHAACFTCQACHSRIEELVFAKTSVGFYCMPCHNRRVARSRKKHDEHRRARQRRDRQKAEEANKAMASEDREALRMANGNSIDVNKYEIPAGMPTISIDDGTQRRQDAAPPSPPAKERPSGSQTLGSHGSASSLSPYQGSASTSGSVVRPGSSGGKRPMQAPPPPVRDPRDGSRGHSGQSPERGRISPSGSAAAGSTENLADDVTPSGSASSLSTAVPASRERAASPSQDSLRDATRSAASEDGRSSSGTSSPPKEASQAAGVSIESAAPKSGTPLAASGPSPAVNGFSVDSAARSQFSSSSDYSQETQNGTAAQNGSTSEQTSTGVEASSPSKRPYMALPEADTSARMSKTFSFYDSDFIQLMDSFGRFDSNENFQLSSPMLDDEAESKPSLAIPGTTSRAAKRSSIRPPLKLEEQPPEVAESGAHTDQSKDAPVAPPSGHSDTEKEVLRDESDLRKDAVDKTDNEEGLSRLSATMRASMQRAKDGHVSMDISFLEMVLKDLDETRDKMQALQTKYDRIKRASQQAAQGFSMAKEEFANEVNARHEAEMEMAKLRRELVDQAFKLATMSSEKRQQEKLEQRTHDVRASLRGMERDLTKLMVERDLTVAEVAELLALQDGSSSSKIGAASASTASKDAKEAAVTGSLAKRLEEVKSRYRLEIDDLSMERDSLLIEIEELKQSRELFLEEARSLNAKNEELNLLYSQLTRKVEQANHSRDELPALPRASKVLPPGQFQAGATAKAGFGFGFGKPPKHHAGTGSVSSTIDSVPAPPSADNLASIDSTVHRVVKPEKVEPATMAKKFRWMAKPKLADASKLAGNLAPSSSLNGHNGALPPVPPKNTATNGTAHIASAHKASHDMVVREHLFQPFNVLRPTRCIACQKNMWGQSEMRCAICSQVCHSKCLHNLSLSCNQPYTRPEDAVPDAAAGPSMFGRDLVEQASIEGRDVPLVVDKCIQAVEAFGMDYEGIYRKSGGSSQLKVITQLFERGAAFDLDDADRFNDVSAITSVLKNYFRELPVPLLTFELHEEFIQLVEAKLAAPAKAEQMGELIAKLPAPHRATLKELVTHLHRVQQRSEENRMNARNLGVVFGPTLMKSGDPTQEFAHMGGKAMTIEYFIEHAETLFA